MARKSGYIMRRGVMRRETVWLGGLVVRTALGSPSTAAIHTSLAAPALALRPFTVVRTRGYFHWRSDQSAASENQDVAYGNVIVSDQAAAVGVTAVPTPATDSDSDLFYVYEAGTSRIDFQSAVGVRQNFGYTITIDSKAMRKVGEDQDLLEVVETAATSAGATVVTFTRTLVKLH